MMAESIEFKMRILQKCIRGSFDDPTTYISHPPTHVAMILAMRDWLRPVHIEHAVVAGPKLIGKRHQVLSYCTTPPFSASFLHSPNLHLPCLQLFLLSHTSNRLPCNCHRCAEAVAPSILSNPSIRYSSTPAVYTMAA